MVFPAILLSALALVFMTVDQCYVAVPGFTCIILVIWLWMTLWDRDQQLPFFDVGVFCALSTLVYTVYPLMNYWADGLQFGVLSDFRLRSYNPDPFEIGIFHLRHVLYLSSFVIFYSKFRGTGAIGVGKVLLPDNSTRQVIMIFFILLTGYFFLLQILTGVDFNSSYENDTYQRKIASVEALPLFVLQISSKLAGILLLLKLALLFIVVNRCRERRWIVVLLTWVTAEIVLTIIIRGSRTGLVVFLVSAALMYHRMIKSLSIKFLLMSGVSFLMFFIFMGLYREYTDFASLQVDLSRTNAGIFSGGNEFQVLLGTAFDVLQRKNGGAHLPWYLYINDFVDILPPQQFMPFEKVGGPEWYLREIGLSQTGLGLMWGVISQSIVGLDWIELALRGGVLGFVLAKVHVWYLRRQDLFLANIFYVYLCTMAYYTFRDTTGSLLSFVIWGIIPFYILLRMGVSILPHSESALVGLRITPPASRIK